MSAAIDVRRAILAKIEATYGTDPTPTGAANAIITKNFKVRPQVQDQASRNDIDLPWLGSLVGIPANTHMEMEFDVEVTGASAAGTSPPYGPLLRSCALGETLVAVTSVTYAEISSAFESSTIYGNIDGMLYKMTGCRGTVALNMKVGEIPTWHFKMVGLYNAVTDIALPSLTLTAWQDPLPVNRTNTPTFTLAGYAAGLWSMMIDLGRTTPYVPFAATGSEQVFVTRRQPTAKFVIEHPTIAQKDFYLLAKNGTAGALSCIHGTGAGKILTITAAQLRLMNPNRADQQGVSTLELDGEFGQTVAGNNELTFAFT